MNQRLNYLTHDLRWCLWKLRNPGRPYGAFYADYIARRIARGERHPSLSQAPKDPALYVEGARKRVDFLRGHGLAEDSRFVDYGCGGLRVGKLLIPLLGAGCYWGVDIADDFFQEGYASLDPDLVAAKSPRVGVISPDERRALCAFDPDIIYVGGVLYHVPPWEVKRFFRELSAIITARSRCFVTVRLGPHGSRLGFMRWAYSLKRLRPLLQQLDLDVTAMDDPVVPVKEAGTHNAVLLISRMSFSADSVPLSADGREQEIQGRNENVG